MALCEVWPESPDLDHFYDPRILDGPHDSLSLAYAVRITCLKAPADDIEAMIVRFTANPRAGHFREAIVSPVVKRLRRDDPLADRLTARLLGSPSPSEKATLTRLLASSKGMSSELRSWALAEISRQMGEDGLSEIGFDLVAGEIRPVWHALMDELG